MQAPPRLPDPSNAPGGTHKPQTSKRCWERQKDLSNGIYWARYPLRVETKGGMMRGPYPDGIQHALYDHVWQLNLQRLRRVPGTSCPFPNGCDLDKPLSTMPPAAAGR